MIYEYCHHFNKSLIFLDCWNGEPNNRPTINQVIAKLKEIITKDDVITKDITSISLSDENANKQTLIENCFNIIVHEINVLFNDGTEKGREHEIFNYLNNHNIASQEVYNW